MKIYWHTEVAPSGLVHIDDCITSSGNTIYKVSVDVIPDDSSYRYRALMVKPMVMLKFALPEFVEIPVGAWIEFFGQKYYLRCPEDIKKQGTRNIEYTLNLYDRSSELGDYKLRNTVDRRLKFSMCAKPHEFLQLIVDNLNERDGNVWEVGTYIDANEKTVEFNHVFIDAGLQAVADEFKTEWQVSPSETAGKFKVSLGKVELPMPPLPLGYGKGNGFVPGVGRTSKSEEKPVKRLYVQGGEENIDRSKNLPSLYRGTAVEGDTTSAALLLPIGQSIRYDGKHFEGEADFDSSNARTYTVDEDGYSIMRTDVVSTAVKEDSLDLSEIYPKRVGHITEVRLGTEGSEEYARKEHFYDIVDDSPDIPNYRDYLIKGETMTIIFQSGMLAGREFEVDYFHDAKDDIPGKRFKLTPAEIDGITMPDPETGFFPKEKHGNVGDEDYYPGDEYAVFGVMLPDSYICDNATKTGAAWDMFREAVKYLYEHEDQKFTFTGELQGLWAKRNWGYVGAYMSVGAYILFTDNQFAKEGVKIRVVGVKEFLNNPYAPTLEISNDVGASSTVSTQLREADNAEVIIGETKSELQQFTKRRFRDAIETLTALQEVMGDNFSSAINPVTIQTMATLIGDESLQFTLGRMVGDSFVPDKPQINWNAGTRKISIPARWLKHLTLGQNTITTHERRDTIDSQNCPMWDMPEWLTAEVGTDEDRLYLYAVCPTGEGQTAYELRSTPRPLKQGDTYYFLVGILSSEYEGERSFVTVYGFTEILPGRITVDRLISTDGESWLDLNLGAMRLGDWLQYNVDDDKTLRLKFLASENANIGGWIVKNGKLVAPNDSMYFDGGTGAIHLKGTIQHSTATSGNYSNVDLFSLPKRTTPKEIPISMGVEDDDIGKRCLLTNMSDFGSMGYYRMAIQRFGWTDEHTKYIGSSENYIIAPGETIEMTCFALKNGDTVRLGETDHTVQRGGFWKITNRYNREIPRAVAMGTVVNTTTGATIKGWSLGGTDMQVSRNGIGSTDATYTITLPEVFDTSMGLLVMVHGVGTTQGGNNPIKATLISQSGRNIVVRTSDDASDNAGSFNFLCYDVEGWQ